MSYTGNTLDTLLHVLAERVGADEDQKEILYRFFALEASTAASAPLPRVIAFDGQSNIISDQPSFGFSAVQPLLGPDLLGWNHVSQKFETLADRSASPPSNTNGTPGAGQIGTRMMRAIANTIGGIIRCIGFPHSGTGIDYARKTSTTRATFADASTHTTLNDYQLRQLGITLSGIPLELYIWCGGEANAGMTQENYYAQFKPHCLDILADNPRARILVIGTIGNTTDRISPPNGSISGVRAAQQQVVGELSNRMLFLDNTDMRGNRAWYDGVHYGTINNIFSYAGPEETALRAMAMIQGATPRAAVSPANHLSDALAWTHIWGYSRIISTVSDRDQVTSWTDAVGSAHFTPEVNAPSHVKSHVRFGGRSIIDFNPSNNESFVHASIGTGSNQWTIACCVRLDPGSSGDRNVWQLEDDTGGTDRLAFQIASAAVALAPALFVNGSDVAFTGVSAQADGVAHGYVVTYNGTAGEAKLYIDGVLASTINGLANITSSPTKLRIGSLSGAAFFFGQIAYIAIVPAVVANTTQVANIHAWEKVEFKLAA